MKYFELVKKIKDILLPTDGEYAGFEAEKITGIASGTDSARLFMMMREEAPDDVCRRAVDIARVRSEGKPLEYITKSACFFGLDFYVDERVLVPRTDTEVIVEKAVEACRSGAKIADICCGSGCIGLSVLKNVDGATADMFDISEGACEVSLENARRLGLSERANILRQDVFSSDFLSGGEKYDIIISNPPYIRTEVIKGLSAEVKNEPHIALDGGDDGLAFYRRLLDVCPKALSDGGAIMFEIGYDQAADVTSEAEKRGLGCEIFRDYGGNDRCAIIKK